MRNELVRGAPAALPLYTFCNGPSNEHPPSTPSGPSQPKAPLPGMAMPTPDPARNFSSRVRLIRISKSNAITIAMKIFRARSGKKISSRVCSTPDRARSAQKISSRVCQKNRNTFRRMGKTPVSGSHRSGLLFSSDQVIRPGGREEPAGFFEYRVCTKTDQAGSAHIFLSRVRLFRIDKSNRGCTRDENFSSKVRPKFSR